MKSLIYLVIGTLLLTSCGNAQTNVVINYKPMGGPNINGKLYQKRYPKEGDPQIIYNTWQGVEVTSNEELELLYKKAPDCEAIKFYLWNHDTLQNFELTEKIGKFEKLKFLEIHSNRITKYPKSIEQLTNLEELVLQTGNKTEIEFNFSNFQQLKHLTIHFASNLKMFPTSVFECKKLETLKLLRFFNVDNKELHGIENLVNLREVYIWDSDLILPEKDYNFRQLESLIFDRNRAQLPDYFFNSQTIRRLALGSIYEPLDLSKVSGMKNLENLNLSAHSNFTGELRLEKLEHLNITKFNDIAIGIDYNTLKSLQSLVIWSCGKVKDVGEISGEKLRSITIIDNNKLEVIKFNEAHLPVLEEVIMRANNSLKVKPREVSGVAVSEK